MATELWAGPVVSARAEIRIALAAPLSGPQAAAGLALERGLAAAIHDANAAGGLLHEELILITQDDGCARATGEGAAAALIARAPAVVIGHPCSSAAVAAAPIYAKAGVLFIAVDARHPDVTGRGLASSPVLRLAGRDDRQGQAAARWLARHAPEGRIAIVHDRTVYARAIADGAVSSLKAMGVPEAQVLALVAGKPDYDDIALRLSELRAEAVLFAGYPEEATIVATELAERGLTVPMLASDSLATPQFAAFAAAAALPIRVLLPDEPGPQGATDATGADADPAATRAHAALEAWVAAAVRAGSRDATAVAQVLRGGSVATRALGAVAFDANGDLVTDAFVPASAHDGHWVRER